VSNTGELLEAVLVGLVVGRDGVDEELVLSGELSLGLLEGFAQEASVSTGRPE